jgi:hypothetical protein
MIVMILGFSKSGTTLAAKTLHEVGVNMGNVTTGKYPGSPYEDPDGCAVIMKSFGIEKKQSLFIPSEINYNATEILNYINMRSSQSKNWGFKFPYLTLVYGEWKKYLPEHIAFAMKRKPKSLLTHYTRGKQYKKEFAEKVFTAQKIYNNLIDLYDIPVIWFEDFLRDGPIHLEKIIGRKLPDMRNYEGRGDGRKYLR